MSIRVPTLDTDLLADANKLLKKQPSGWHSITCELVTPMYGGGIVSHIIDKEMPIRVSGIRGQLRFWWRLLAKHKWKLGDDATIRKQELKLWGGMDDDVSASKIFLKLEVQNKPDIEPWAQYKLNKKKRLVLTPECWADVAYALFPAQGKTESNKVTEHPHSLLKPGLQWILNFKIDECEDKTKIIETLHWWANFGGVGARTRRGLGAFKVSCKDFPHIGQPLQADEIEQVGCQLVLKRRAHNPLDAWQLAVSAMKDFRQGEGTGRVDKYGASLWPEANYIRGLNNLNKVEVEGGSNAEIFPRGFFGMPIIFNMPHDNRLKNSTLTLRPSQEVERMASPIILRPIYVGNKNWHAGALLLPIDSNLLEKVTLTSSNSQDFDDLSTWSDEAKDIKAIQDNTEDVVNNPLQAFMTYFAD